MTRRFPLCLAAGLLLALPGCNRHSAADVTLDADAAQRNTTAAKTLSDLAAADAASRQPLPATRAAVPTEAAPKPQAAPAPEEESDETPAEASDESQSNE